jgi:cysteine desulfurase
MVVSRIEHPSTIAAAIELQRRGWQIDWIRAEESGSIDLNHCHELICSASQPPPRLVSLMLANNETGVVQPVREVVDLCRPRGIPVHTDAVQAMGRSPVRFDDLGVTLMTVAAHKFHGPTGIGALLVRGRTSLQPILFGGSQQLGMRPGTEPVALAVGMKRALELAMERLTAGAAHLRQVRDSLEIQLMSLPEARVNGTAERLPHSLNMSFLGLDRQALLMALDLAGVYCSTGSACSSGSSEPSHVLQAMGLSGERVASALRFSVGMTTKLSDVTLAGERILNAVNQLRS